MAKNKVIYRLNLEATTKNYPKEMKMLQRTKQHGKVTKDEKILISSSLKLISLFHETLDHPQVLDHSRELLLHLDAAQKPHIQEKIFCLLRMAESCRILEDFGKAISFANRGFSLANDKKVSLPLDSLDFCFELGLCYMMRGESEGARLGDFDAAANTFAKAARLLDIVRMSDEDKERLKVDIQTNLAIIQKNKGDLDGSLVILENLIATSFAKKNDDTMASLLCNMAYCHDAKKKFKTALKFGREEMKIRKAINDFEGEKQSILDNATRYENALMFSEALKLVDYYEARCKERCDFPALAKKDTEVRRATLKEKVKQSESVAGLREELRKAEMADNKRLQMDLHQQIGEIQYELGEAMQAIASFTSQKSIASSLSLPTALTVPISLSLTKACLAADQNTQAEQHLRHILTLLPPNSPHQVPVRQQLVESILASSKYARRAALELLYDEVSSISEPAQEWPWALWAAEGVLAIHSFYAMHDHVRVDRARVARIRQKLQLGREVESDEENMKPIGAVLDRAPRIKEGGVVRVEGMREGDLVRMETAKVKARILQEEEDGRYSGDEDTVEDVSSPPVFVSKRKRKIITLDDMDMRENTKSERRVDSSSLPPPVVKKSSAMRVEFSSSSAIPHEQDIVMGVIDECSLRLDEQADVVDVASRQIYPNTLSLSVDALFNESAKEEVEEVVVVEEEEVPPTPVPMKQKLLKSSSPLFPVPTGTDNSKHHNMEKTMEPPSSPPTPKTPILPECQRKVNRSSEPIKQKPDRLSSDKVPGLLDHPTLNEKYTRDTSTPIPRLQVSYLSPEQTRRTMTIPYPPGPNMTPKTVSWLIRETRLRYKERHGIDPPSKNTRILSNGEQVSQRDVIAYVCDDQVFME